MARQLDESWKSYAMRLRRFRRTTPPPSVHKLRVSTRRLLTSLDLLVELARGGSLKRVRNALRAHFKEMGMLRDAEVQIGELKDMALPKAKRRILRRVLEKRARRLAGLVAKATDVGLAKEIQRIEVLLTSAPPGPASDQKVRSAVNRALGKALGQAKRLCPRSAQGLGHLHRGRIAIKRLRYMAEFVHPVAGADRKLLKRLAHCQTLMGDIHDAEVMMARLKKWKSKARIKGREFRNAMDPITRRRVTLLVRYFRAADKLFAGKGPAIEVAPA